VLTRDDGADSPPATGEVVLSDRRDAGPAARRRQRTVRDRLTSLLDRGDVADVEAETWPRAVPLADPLGTHARAREAYATFESWAERAGVSLSPFFDRRERYTLEDPSAATRECLLPVVALTLHDGEEVVAAYPHTADGDRREVDDALATPESASGPSAGVETGTGSRTDPRVTAD
jgi:hypothetical protein